MPAFHAWSSVLYNGATMTQDEALKILKTGANVFLTGEPGSGKTHTINQYVSYLNFCGIEPAVTASTGIAATHISGMTIHSWCGIGIRHKLTPYDLDSIAGNKKVIARVWNARVLIIDEVSMLSAQTLAMADAICREVRRKEEPFGGLQVVFVGDFFQLPPISRQEENRTESQKEMFAATHSQTGGYAADFAFVSSVWQKAAPIVCYLSEQHRQDDKTFLEFLGAVRRGTVAERHKELLRTRYRKTAENGTTQLYSHNANVDHINTTELSKLPGEPKVFVMTGRGPDPLTVALKRGCLSPEVLSLKLGARVMFTKNDIAGRFMNGTTGVIAGFSKETGTPIVKTGSGRMILAEPLEWNMQDGGRILARIIQVPLRLAWAITVHKSQGMSLDSAHMDLSGAFEYGQGYVAISRVRTLQGLSLSGLNARALEVHPKVFSRDKHFRAESDAAREKFQTMDERELAELHNNFIRALGGKPGAEKPVHKKKEKVETLSLTRRLVSRKLSLAEMAKERSITIGTVIHHLEQLTAKGALNPEHDLMHLSPDPDRFAKIEKAFKKISTQATRGEQDTFCDSSGLIKLSPVRSLLDDSYSFDELRLARLFLHSVSKEEK
ncbi:MAG: AAA ATPase [Parcubacteria group bacterium GW2011_GWA2_47_64]|nr:MAG: AAA ATPase [Parcubacteria group bacterium GW2011_GWA2_47_64]KKU97024.1 MAG: AAA ATPase [Parcubacteria group bacterium GW2011_GWC2_48_17]